MQALSFALDETIAMKPRPGLKVRESAAAPESIPSMNRLRRREPMQEEPTKTKPQ